MSARAAGPVSWPEPCRLHRGRRRHRNRRRVRRRRIRHCRPGARCRRGGCAVRALYRAHQRLEGALAGLHRLLGKLGHRPHDAAHSAAHGARHAGQHLLNHLHLLLPVCLVGREFGSGIGGVRAAVRVGRFGICGVLRDAGVAGRSDCPLHTADRRWVARRGGTRPRNRRRGPPTRPLVENGSLLIPPPTSHLHPIRQFRLLVPSFWHKTPQTVFTQRSRCAMSHLGG